MKEVRETKLVEQTTVRFIADDGTEFSNEKDCKSYENIQNKEKCLKEFNKLNPIVLDIPFIDFGGCCSATLINVKSESDFDIVVDYYKSLSSWMDYADLISCKPQEFPSNIICLSGEEWVCVSNKTIEDIKIELLNVYSILNNIEV